MKTLKPKVAIIGAGNVGATFAFALMIKGIAREIVIVDKNDKKAAGECMDLNHGLNFIHPAAISAQGYEGCVDSDIVVITAGANQKPGQTRIDLAQANTEIFKDIIAKVMKYAKDAIILVVTNPVDILTYVTLKISGLPVNRVMGSGTALDTSRFRYLLGEHCGVDTRNVHAYIIGEHGDTELPVWSNASIGGMKIERYCLMCKDFQGCDKEKKLGELFDEVKNAAYKIIEAKGSTYYAVALALVRITEVILRDENSILPVSTLMKDYYGVKDVCLSLPCVVNRSGVDRILNIELSEKEQSQFKYSADTLKEVIKSLKF
jgi:L-lactate dehydrogenase